MCLPIFIRCFEGSLRGEYQAEILRQKWIRTFHIGNSFRELSIKDQKSLACFLEEVAAYMYKLTGYQLIEEFPEFHGSPEAILEGAIKYFFILKKGE